MALFVSSSELSGNLKVNTVTYVLEIELKEELNVTMMRDDADAMTENKCAILLDS